MSAQDQDSLPESRAACQQFDIDLPAYLEGEHKPEVLAHARQCPYCRVLLADLDMIRFASHHLPQTNPPDRIWANVRARLASKGVFQEQISGWRRWFPRFVFQPASGPVGALACLTIFSLILLTPVRSTSDRAPGPREASFGGKAPIVAAVVPSLDSNLLETIRDMEATYQAREGLLDPVLKATYRKSLEALNACILECLSHCQRDPANALAREYLLNAYRLKAEVLASALSFDAR